MNCFLCFIICFSSKKLFPLKFLPPFLLIVFCRYFHPPGEIIAGAVFGLVLFQVPLLFLSARLLQAHEDEDIDNDDKISS